MKRSQTEDDVFMRAPPDRVYPMLESLPRDAAWWPGARARQQPDGLVALRFPSFKRRSRAVRLVVRVEGVRPGVGFFWKIERGELSGKGEWWLEPVEGGTVVHYLLGAQPGRRGRTRRFSSRVRRHRWAVRRGMNALKDRLERTGAVERV